MSACAEALSPGVQATSVLQSGSAIGTERGLQPMQNCPGNPGPRPDPLSRRQVDNALLCGVACCCAANPLTGADGRNLFQGCVEDTLGQADQGLGYASRYKPEISYNMQTAPPAPFMHRQGGADTTEPSHYWRGRAKDEIENYARGRGQVRRPDVVIVNDPCQPPSQGNIERVVEFKFFGDERDLEQDTAYEQIAGGATKYSVFRIGGKPAKDEQGCDCGQQKQPQPAPVPLPAPRKQDVTQRQGGWGAAAGALGWSAVTALGAVATAALALIPFDGPAGEIAAGTATAAAAARAASAWRAVAAAF